MYQTFLDEELIVDNFAGGGGASCGIEQALGRPIHIAINHDIEAIGMHMVNHPATHHYCENVWDINPALVCKGRPVGLAWFSPDCKHFSKAKGGKPVEKKIRGLAWVVLRWAATVKPRIICLENVEEFTTWGPLTREGLPDPKQKGRTFNSFVNALKRHGYVVEWRELKAADYGTPTIRKRLFMIARCDGQPIVWPEATHSANPAELWPNRPVNTARKSRKKPALGALPYLTAAQCIDWHIPCPSIFTRARALQDNTLRRIARGMRRYVIDAKEPFIVTVNHGGDHFRGSAIREPLDTMTQKNGFGVVSPHIVNMAHGGKVEPTDGLFSTIATEKGGCRALVAPYLAGVGGRTGQSPERPVDKAYHTTTAKADTVLVSPYMVGAGGPERAGQPRASDIPSQTVMTRNDTYLVAPYMVGAGGSEYAGKPRSLLQAFNTMTTHNRSAVIASTLIEVGHGEAPGQQPRAPGLHKPLGTVCAGGRHHAVTSAFIVKHYGGMVGTDIRNPAPTQTTRGTQNQLATAYMTKLRGDNVGDAADEPLHTISAGGTHHAETRAFLIKYFGTDQDPRMADPMHTVTTKDRFGLVQAEMTVPPNLTDEQRYNAWCVVRMLEHFGELPLDRSLVPSPRPAMIMLGDYIIVDIGMRMLTPRELYRAQGFPEDYIIDRAMISRQDKNGVFVVESKPLTKTAQVRMCGNSVCPPLARAIVAANMTQTSLFEQRRAMAPCFKQ